MSEVVVRAARTAELTEIGELTVAAYRVDGLIDGTGGYEVTLRDTVARAQGAELLVAVDGAGVVLGTVTVARPGTPYAEVSREGELEFRMLAVAPYARGRGAGEALIQAVLDQARDLGVARVVMCTRETMRAARRLYDRFGFTRLPERDWEPVAGVSLLGFGLELA